MFEKRQIGAARQYDLMSSGFHGAPGIQSQLLNVLHGNGRFSPLWEENPGGGAKSLIRHVALGEACKQFVNVNEESLGRAVLSNTAKIDGKQLMQKAQAILTAVKKIDQVYRSLAVNGIYPSGSNPDSRLALVVRRIYNNDLDQKTAKQKMERKAKETYDKGTSLPSVSYQPHSPTTTTTTPSPPSSFP
jgi:hypothetical protein